MFSETCLNRTLNKPKSCMNQTLNKIPIYVIFNLYNQTSTYSKQKSLFGFMVLNATFTNISVISWRSVLLMEETGENHWAVVSNRQTLKLYRVHLTWAGFELATLVVIALIAQVVLNPTTIRSLPRRPPKKLVPRRFSLCKVHCILMSVC
jgi:hypothetical protein